MLSVRGVYDGKEIKSLEHFEAKPNTEIIITFTDRLIEPIELKEKSPSLLDFCGTWEDERSAQEIIDDIYNSRTSNERDINL